MIENSSFLAHGPGRAADRAGGERRCGCDGFPQEGYHRQPELLDRAARRRACKPLHDVAKIKRVVVATYQSVSGRRQGCDGRTVLADQGGLHSPAKWSRRRSFRSVSRSTSSRNRRVHGRRLSPRKNGRWWSRPRRFSIPRSRCTATCVRVPVFIGHSEAVNIEFEKPISVDEAREHPTQCAGLSRDRQARAGRLRHAVRRRRARTRPTSAASATDPTVDNGLVMRVRRPDNLRKGAALNAIQIAECLINRKLIRSEERKWLKSRAFSRVSPHRCRDVLRQGRARVLCQRYGVRVSSSTTARHAAMDSSTHSTGVIILRARMDEQIPRRARPGNGKRN